MNDELAQRIINDHHTLDRLFNDLESSLQHMVDDDEASPHEEFLQDTQEDLSFALEEMFEHFGVEEEAIFLHIQTAVPSLSRRLQSLERAHEVMATKTGRLRKMVSAAQVGASTFNPGAALSIVKDLRHLLEDHNAQEVAIFLEALKNMNEEDQKKLMENLERL